MDQYRSKLKLSENFERHWSIRISGEIHMDQSLVHTFSWGNSYGPMVLKVLRKFPPTLVLVHGWLFPAFKGKSKENGIQKPRQTKRCGFQRLPLQMLIWPGPGIKSASASAMKIGISGIFRPMVCQTSDLHAGRLSRERRKSRK